MKPKLLYYRILNFQPDNLRLLGAKFNVIELKNPLADRPEFLSQAEAAFAPLGFIFDKNKIDQMTKLKVIASNTTGEPHIDRAYAESKGIKVFSLKYDQNFLKTITPTAEHTWGLLLALIRHTPWAFDSVLAGKWNRRLFGGQAMISHLSLGVVGLGRLGKIIVRYAKAFGMKKINFFDPYFKKQEPAGLVRLKSLKELVGSSDIVTIHIPAEKENYKIFNRELFSKFKKGSFLINTSRAELVDEAAMLESLKTGHLAGAAIDVFDGEFEINHDELLKKSPLRQYAKSHDNLLITPHIGGSTIDAWTLTERRVIDMMIDQFKKNKSM